MRRLAVWYLGDTIQNCRGLYGNDPACNKLHALLAYQMKGYDYAEWEADSGHDYANCEAH
jgi:hypothetical protein